MEILIVKDKYKDTWFNIIYRYPNKLHIKTKDQFNELFNLKNI